MITFCHAFLLLEALNNMAFSDERDASIAINIRETVFPREEPVQERFHLFVCVYCCVRAMGLRGCSNLQLKGLHR